MWAASQSIFSGKAHSAFVHQHQTHPLHVRIGHWINALTLLALLWSGFAMFASNRQFSTIVHALPPWFWRALQLHGNATVGRAWHLGFALVMIANAPWYAIASVRTASWRRLVPNARTWLRDAVRATIAELRSPRATMHRTEYNGAQKVAYTGVMLLGALMIVTGLALWLRRRLPWLIGALGGQHVVLPAHVVIATLFLGFIAIHMVQVLRAGVPTLLSMIVGTTELRPARGRRALVWSGGVLAALVVGFTIIRFTSGPTGVPTYLQWAVERGDRQGDRSLTGSSTRLSTVRGRRSSETF
ncbi:MAG TPA: cytochrome b/b6 domain-containing protein [Candidatus Tyrphobacter sp.]